MKCLRTILTITIGVWFLVSAEVRGQTLQTINELFPIANGGRFPAPGLAQGQDGLLYGATSDGGAYNMGTLFKATTGGNLSTLLSFDGSNGARPASPIFGRDGYLYGVSAGSGTAANGTFFRCSTDGVLSTLAVFQGTNGSGPRAPLLQSADGKFYGVTFSGGLYGFGTIFSVTTNGILSSLFSFNGTNGSMPADGLVQGADGSLYGSTTAGGSNFNGNASSGLGTVFRFTTNGLFSTLVYFSGTNGSAPRGLLSPRGTQALYGVGSSGGDHNLGTVFQVNTNGSLATLLSFDGTNGAKPFSGLTQGADGSYYGTTAYRLTNSAWTNGTVFRLATNGVLTTLIYLNGTNGLNPAANLVLASDGNLYGAMADIQKNYCADGSAGSVFRLVEWPQVAISVNGNGALLLNWNSFANGIYRIDEKSSATDSSWNVLVPSVPANDQSTSYLISPSASGQRYYRVVLLP